MNIAQMFEISVLTYHSIDKSDSVISLKPEIFLRQMKFLSENGFNVISLKTLREQLVGNEKILSKTIVLTFDDGFENFYTTAFPILNDYNFSATVFLITDFCDENNNWLDNSSMLKPDKLMGWREIKELNDNNIEFASHTKTHPDLTKLSSAEVKRELLESKQTIEERLGTEVLSLAYPYGKFNITVRNIAREYFKLAFSTNLGKVNLIDDFFALRRLDVYYLKNEYIFRSILSGKFDWYIHLRQILREKKALIYRK